MNTKISSTVQNLDSHDADYMAAVSLGNIETAQRLIDEAAQIAGYLIVAWHGSQSDTFLDFNEGKIGMNMGKNPKDQGFRFTDDPSVAQEFSRMNPPKHEG